MKQAFYSLIILTAMIPSLSFAYQGSELALFTPWKYIDQELKTFFSSQSLTNEQELGDFDVTFDPLTWHLKGVEVRAQANYQSGPVTENSYQLSASNMKIIFSLQSMSVDQVIQKVINGAIVNVHVQATCGPIILTQPSAQISGELGFQASGQTVTTEINQFGLSWAPDSWSISTVICSGPGGFDDELREQLVQQLQTADGVKSFISQALEEKIQSEVGSFLDTLIKPQAIPASGSTTPLTIQLRDLQTFPQGALATGAIVWSGNPDEQNILPLKLDQLPSQVAASSQPVIVTPTEGWSDLISAQLNAAPLELSYSLNQNSSFQNVLDCWLLKLFLWPDLLHYSSQSPFQVVVQTPQDLGLRWNNNGSATFQTSTTGFVTSVRSRRQWVYLLLSGSFQGTATPAIQDGNFSLKIATTTSKLGLKFGTEYVKYFAPSTFIASTIQKSVQSYLSNGISFQTALPSFDLGSFGTAKFQAWQGIGDGLILTPLELVHR